MKNGMRQNGKPDNGKRCSGQKVNFSPAVFLLLLFLFGAPVGDVPAHRPRNLQAGRKPGRVKASEAVRRVQP